MNVFFEHEHRFAVHTSVCEFVDQLTLLIDLRVGLSNLVELLFHRREIDDLIGQFAVLNFTVRAFDKAVLVDARMGCERVDQTNVRAFWRFNWADPAIVGRVNVSNLKARTLTRQTARPKRRETSFVRNL